MNMHATIEELPFLCTGKVTHLYINRGLLRKWCFLRGLTPDYITRTPGQLESELRESLEMAVDDDGEGKTQCVI
jgi:hypothetical protein